MNSILRILHVIPGIWEHTGGPCYTIPTKCMSLVKNNCTVTLATLDGHMPASIQACRVAGVNVKIFRPTFQHTIWYSNEMRKILPGLAKEADIIHTHGLWAYPVWLSARITREYHKPLVMSLHGTLRKEALKKSFWKKALSAILFDNKNLRSAGCLHAQTEYEKNDLRAYGLVNPIAVIPDAINIIESGLSSSGRDKIDDCFPACRGKRLLLCMSRINPVKGLLDLADAWGEVASKFPEWHLLIAGPDERGYLKRVKEAFDRHNAMPRVTYAGPLYGKKRITAFHSSELFISPTHTESFGMAIGEALGTGLPVITTYAAPWEGIETHHCGWRVPVGREGLVSALNEALPLSQDKLREMGMRGKKWVREDFTPDKTAQKMISVYKWLMNRCTKPDFVI